VVVLKTFCATVRWIKADSGSQGVIGHIGQHFGWVTLVTVENDFESLKKERRVFSRSSTDIISGDKSFQICSMYDNGEAPGPD